MSKPKVYLETTIIGYLAMRPSRDLIVAANQQLTKEWWDNNRDNFDLFVSRFVVDECAAGDPTAADERKVFLDGISVVDDSEDVDALANALILAMQLPAKAVLDAYHIATAATNGIEYLLTWNCTHIANASLRSKIEAVCRDHELEPPVICTPQELSESNDNVP